MKITRIVSLRGRGNENIQTLEFGGTVSHALTSVQKDNLLMSIVSIDKKSAILRKYRTDEGKLLRKQGIDSFQTRNYQPAIDGIANTITGILKDNYLLEIYESSDKTL